MLGESGNQFSFTRRTVSSISPFTGTTAQTSAPLLRTWRYDALYSYDNISQLKVATSSISGEDRGYTYDAAWNLNYLTNDGALNTFTVDNQNELASDPNAPNDTYDANGNLQIREWSGLLLYAYTNDDENRLTAIEYDDYGASPPDSLSQFVYDGLGRMRKRVDTPTARAEPGLVADAPRITMDPGSSRSAIPTTRPPSVIRGART